MTEKMAELKRLCVTNVDGLRLLHGRIVEFVAMSVTEKKGLFPLKSSVTNDSWHPT